MSEASALLALLKEFHISDRALCRARDRAQASNDSAAIASLRTELTRYFDAVEREADAQLASIDRKLDDVYQRQYNLQAERGVAERRLLAARRVLGAVKALTAEEAGR